MRYQAILADDERRVRNAIVKQGDWEAFGIELVDEVQDGDALLEAVERQRPSLVLTDMRMPGLNGAELIRTLRDKYPSVQLIIISGYDDFAYMKQAISSRVVDYLLKPVRGDALNEALRQAVRELDARSREKEETINVQRKLNESLPLLNEDIFHQWLTGTNSGEEALLRSLNLPCAPDEPGYTAVACIMDNFAEIAERRFRSNPHLLLYAVVNIANELFEGVGKWFRSRQQDRELIAILYRSLPRQTLDELLEKLSSQLLQLIDMIVLIGVGDSRTHPRQVRDSLNEARAALSLLHTGAKQASIAYYDRLDIPSPSARRQTDGSERRLSAAIDSGNLAFVRQTVDEVYEEASRSDYMSIAAIRKLNAELLHQLERLVDQVAEQRPFLAGLASLRLTVANELNLQFVRTSVVQFLDSLPGLEPRQRKEPKVISRIREYLEQEYMRKHSLKELSDRFFLSKEYISKMFKEEFGTNLFDFLASLKIERAKQLLAGTDAKLRQIVDELGFNDESHFSKAFKKHTGCSPKAYRDQFKRQ